MSLTKLKPTRPLTFKTNGYPESINRVFFEICDEVFSNQSERFRNIANFSYSFTNAISQMILDDVEIDRNRTIDLKAQRTMGSIELTVSCGDSGEDFSPGEIEPKTISLSYPLLK